MNVELPVDVAGIEVFRDNCNQNNCVGFFLGRNCSFFCSMHSQLTCELKLWFFPFSLLLEFIHLLSQSNCDIHFGFRFNFMCTRCGRIISFHIYWGKTVYSSFDSRIDSKWKSVNNYMLFVWNHSTTHNSVNMIEKWLTTLNFYQLTLNRGHNRLTRSGTMQMGEKQSKIQQPK